VSQRESPYSGLRVLVVDDQEHVRRWERTVLTSMGIHDIDEASDGAEAIAAVTRPGVWYDVVLCDLRMPHADGLETLRAFAQLRIESGIAIVSGEDDRVIETSALLTEAHGLRMLGSITKPMTAEKLTAVFEKLEESFALHQRVNLAPAEDLERAFAQSELRLMYQPKVSLRSDQMIGVEALVRWQHPTYGLFPPAAFVPIIEGSMELSGRLAEFTLREAIACAGRARAAGRDIPVAINLSRRTCDRLDLPEFIEHLAKASRVPSESITLEITETAVAHDAVRMLEVATRLRLKGFKLSIDDFGTGESGLSQLKRLPFTELKIDREFVDGCSRSTTQRSVVQASVSLARHLNMTAVGEGVQYRADWNTLLELGCDAVQGFYVATPMTEAQLMEWNRTA